jgi:hypothetical protein
MPELDGRDSGLSNEHTHLWRIGINKKSGLGRSSSYAARHVIDSLAGVDQSKETTPDR